MKRLALFAAVIAVMAGGAASTTAYADPGNGNPTPGCQSSTWTVDLGFTGLNYFMDPLVRCHPTKGSKGTWTLSGTAGLSGGCESATISGTLHDTDFNATWTWTDACTGQVVNLTGTLNWGDNDNPTTGSGSGDWTSNCCGGGTWTAARTS